MLLQRGHLDSQSTKVRSERYLECHNTKNWTVVTNVQLEFFFFGWDIIHKWFLLYIYVCRMWFELLWLENNKCNIVNLEYSVWITTCFFWRCTYELLLEYAYTPIYVVLLHFDTPFKNLDPLLRLIFILHYNIHLYN